jgi:DNA-binding response OmpR family regulator
MRQFELLAILLFAEGERVSKEELALRLAMRGGRDSVNRLVRQLRAMMWDRGQANIVEVLGDGYRIQPPRKPATSRSSQASERS